MKVLVNGEPHKIIVEHKETEETETSSHGTYQLEFKLSQGQIDTAKIQLALSKTSYRTTYIDFTKDDFAQKGQSFYAVKDTEMSRFLGPAFWIATIVFLVAYALISFELLHRTIAAMLGAALMLLITYTFGTLNHEYHIISFERAIQAIDMNVIFLLMGMMIIVGVLKHTGVFQWCAYMSFKIARGNVMALAVISMIFIATTSTMLDNVTTMLLYTPVLIEIALALKLSPLLLLVPGIMASNIGGTATLIGDPPNIMIGSYTGLSFMQFVTNLTIVCIIAKDIEWTTLLFFMFLFVIVGAVEEAGLLAVIADWVLNLSHGNLVIMGRKGRSVFKNLILGGVSSTVLQRCQNPIFAIASSS